MKYFIVCLLAMLLSGCESNQPENVQAGAAQSAEDCHLWCHNGWCSKHCDPILQE